MKYFRLIRNNTLGSSSLYYIIEKGWSIQFDASYILHNLKPFIRGRMVTLLNPNRTQNKIIHFGSINTLVGRNIDDIKKLSRNNHIIATWFHIVPDKIKKGKIEEFDKLINVWHTASNRTKSDLVRLYNIDPEKIKVIPLGVNLKAFTPIDEAQKKRLKGKFGIPDDAILIGSFQKDGKGMDKGSEPKLIKGPDIFCDTIEMLSKFYPLFIMLSGPARGYVKQRLQIAKVPFKHFYFKNPDHISKLYQILDLYLVTSRIEGGPKAILESMAAGTPIISTRVGMADEILMHGENGFITEIEDVPEITNIAQRVIADERLRKSLILNGLKTVKKYDWSIIAEKYFNILYKQFLT